MNPRRFLTLSFLSANVAFGQMLSPQPDRLADYHAWFDSFNPAAGIVAPSVQIPGSVDFDAPARDWSLWAQNVPPGDISGPIVGSSPTMLCEVIFLGATGTSWDRFGYSLSGADHNLCTDIAGEPFGNYALPTLANFDTLDFYIERADGSRYYAFNKSLNTAPATDGHWSTLIPLVSVRGDLDGLAGELALPFTIFAFSPDFGAADPEVFVFAVRAGFDAPADPVPEPATYGLIGAGALAALALVRRYRRTYAPAART
ncbi:MAG TPA: PEP-CTERM sorting domain-containing protein [Opitutaceae bacterium]|nr:PEP-CTERM sorting domain-containing protein [Opitutaceae bacterium]